MDPQLLQQLAQQQGMGADVMAMLAGLSQRRRGLDAVPSGLVQVCLHL